MPGQAQLEAMPGLGPDRRRRRNFKNLEWRGKQAKCAPDRRERKCADAGGRGRGATGASVPVLRLEPAGLGFLDMALQVPIKVEGAKTVTVT